MIWVKKPFTWLILLFVLTIPFVTPYLRGDGNGYYAWLRSPLIDHDFHFENEFLAGDISFLRSLGAEDGSIDPGRVLPNGNIENQWNVGAALFWAPFFAIGYLAALLGNQPLTGFGSVFLWPVALGTAIYTFLGLLTAVHLAQRVTGTIPASLGCLGIWFASSLPIYQYLLPFWPFGVGVFVSSLILLLWTREGWNIKKWVGLGLLCGIAVAIHPVGIAWLALPLSSLVLDSGTKYEKIGGLMGFGGGGVLGISPHLIGKYLAHGSPFHSGYRADMDLLRPDLIRVLVGADHGLISWTPITAIGLVGLVILAKRSRKEGQGLLLTFAAFLWVVGAYQTYEQSSFGNRFFVLFTPGFVIGVSVVIHEVWTRRKALVIGLISILIAWNLMFGVDPVLRTP